MRTATVCELRDNYASVLAWIDSGEEVILTRRGKPISRIVPERAEEPETVDWSQSPALTRDRSGERTLTAGESASILQDASGRW